MYRVCYIVCCYIIGSCNRNTTMIYYYCTAIAYDFCTPTLIVEVYNKTNCICSESRYKIKQGTNIRLHGGEKTSSNSKDCGLKRMMRDKLSGVTFHISVGNNNSYTVVISSWNNRFIVLFLLRLCMPSSSLFNDRRTNICSDELQTIIAKSLLSAKNIS